MGIISVSEIIRIIRTYFSRIVAACLAAGILSYFFVTHIQTYTCTLRFQYNYSAAEEGLAPDGVQKLNPYEIQNPAVIQSAISDLFHGSDTEALNVEGIRNNMVVSEIITTLDNEVKESAAVLGEKYDVIPTEYELKYTYDANLGDEFGAKMFDSIIKSYDDFIISNYYNKKYISDFMKSINEASVDYLDTATVISDNLEDIVSYLDGMAESYPEYRSGRTGYTFADLSYLYQNLRDIQYAKYYGNVRSGNLSKDMEMTIKNYRAKVKELTSTWQVNADISENYKGEITTFYDPYKASGLYGQAARIQTELDSSNTRDNEILRDFDAETVINTYDGIVLNYTEKATAASNDSRQIDYYNMIIDSLVNDTVPQETKDRLIEKNEAILQEMTTLSASYSTMANETINEFFDAKVADDLQYLISTDVSADKPVMLLTIFMMILVGGLLLIAAIVFEVSKKYVVAEGIQEKPDLEKEVFKKEPEGLDEEHHLAFLQYKNNFNEFYLVYQPMIDCKTGKASHFEAFIRWDSPQLGMVAPGIAVDYFMDLNLIPALNNWIIETVCKNLSVFQKARKKAPVIHINCPHSEIMDFGLNDILVRSIKKYHISPSSICLELNGSDIVSCMEDIVTLNNMGIQICIDRFEDKKQENEIIEAIEPNYVKMSADVLLPDVYATTDQDVFLAGANMLTYFSNIIKKCAKKKIGVCICGIENESQDQMISKLGFQYKQGYYYGKPQKLDEFKVIFFEENL